MTPGERSCCVLADMLRSVNLIMRYTKDETAESFATNQRAQDAVVWRLGVIARSVERITLEIRLKYSKIPWERIRGFSDTWRVTVDDPELIWEACIGPISGLAVRLEEVMKVEECPQPISA